MSRTAKDARDRKRYDYATLPKRLFPHNIGHCRSFDPDITLDLKDEENMCAMDLHMERKTLKTLIMVGKAE
jgi:hypothetical protein